MESPPPTSDAGDAGVLGLAQVSLLVRDADQAVAFYRDRLGLHHLFTAGELTFFDLDGVRLYLHAVDDDAWRPGSILYLRVDDVAATYRLLGERGMDLAGAPHLVHTHPDGTQEWMAFVRDPDGNTLGLLALVPPAQPASG